MMQEYEVHDLDIKLFDTIDLKDQLKSLRAELHSHEIDNQRLIEERDSLRESTTDLKRKLRATEHLEKIRFFENEGFNQISDLNKVVFHNNSRHIELNAKLELRILNDNIKASLSRLHGEAVGHQDIAWFSQTLLSKQQKVHSLILDSDTCLSSLLMQSNDDIETIIRDHLTQSSDLRQLIRKDVDTANQQCEAYSNEIKFLTRNIDELRSIRGNHKDSLFLLKQKVAMEESRLAYLKSQAEVFEGLINSIQ